MSDDNNSAPSASESEPKPASSEAGVVDQPERTFTAKEVEAIVRDRLSRAKKEKKAESPGPAASSPTPDVDLESLKAAHSAELAQVAEVTAKAAVDAVAKRLEAEFTAHKSKLEQSYSADLAEVAEVAGVTPKDLLEARRWKRMREGMNFSSRSIMPSPWSDRDKDRR